MTLIDKMCIRTFEGRPNQNFFKEQDVIEAVRNVLFDIYENGRSPLASIKEHFGKELCE